MTYERIKRAANFLFKQRMRWEKCKSIFPYAAIKKRENDLKFILKLFVLSLKVLDASWF